MSFEGMMKAVEANVNEPLNEGMKIFSESLPDFAKDLSIGDTSSFYDADKSLDFGVEGNDLKIL